MIFITTCPQTVWICKKNIYFMTWNSLLLRDLWVIVILMFEQPKYISFEYFDTLNSLKVAALLNIPLHLWVFFTYKNLLVDEGKSPAANSNKNVNENRTQIKLLWILLRIHIWEMGRQNKENYEYKNLCFSDDDIQHTSKIKWDDFLRQKLNFMFFFA